MVKRIAFVMIVSMLVLFVCVNGNAGWRLYDNFNSNAIDPNKWSVDDSCASISVEHGMAKFVHQPGYPDDSAWLIPIRNSWLIKGIRTTVIFEGCDDEAACRDVRGRIGGQIGVDKHDHSVTYWGTESIEPWYGDRDSPRFYGEHLSVRMPGNIPLGSLFWSRFILEDSLTPEDLLGVPYVFTMWWNKKTVTFKINGLGESKYKWDRTYKLDYLARGHHPSDGGIGTKSSKGCGPCTVYFDDVYVLYRI